MSGLILLASSWTTKNVLLSALIVLAVILVEIIAVSLILRKIYGKTVDALSQGKKSTDEKTLTEKSSTETLSTKTASDAESAATDTAISDASATEGDVVNIAETEDLATCDATKPVSTVGNEPSTRGGEKTDYVSSNKPTIEAISEEERNKIYAEVFGLDKLPDFSKLDAETESQTVTVSDAYVARTTEEIYDSDEDGENATQPDYLKNATVVYKPNFASFNAKIRYVKSFSAKLCQSSDLLKERYSALKNDLLSYKKTKDRLSWHYETFRAGRPIIAKFSISGKTLSLYLALDPSEFTDTKYHFKDVSAVKKYQAVPMRLKIKSNRSVRWAKELIYIMSEKLGLKRIDREEVDYYPEYMSLEQLIELKQVKVIRTLDANSDVQDDVMNDDLDNACDYVEPSNLPNHRVEPPVAVIAEVILDDEDFETYSQMQEVAVTATEETDEELSVKSDETAENYGDEQGETAENNGVKQGETAENNGVKDVKSEEFTNEAEQNNGDDDVVKQHETTDNDSVSATDSACCLGAKKEPHALAERDFEIVGTVTVTKAENEMTDEKAQSLIETVSKIQSKLPKGDKKAIVNIDTLSKCFNENDTVDLNSLISKNLVSKKTGYVKVLGRGVLDKPLIVEANDFTVNAVKMILLTGGRVVQIED